MKIKLLITTIALLVCTSCSVNKLISEANDSFSRKEYFIASEKYKLANPKIKDKSQKPQIYFNLAESYRQQGDYTKAAIWYKNAIRSGYKDSLTDIRYADALRGAGKPEEAKPIYEAALKKYPSDTQAANGLKSIRQINDWKEVPELYLIENLKPINSLANDRVVQISPETKQTIYLRSSREDLPEKKLNPASGQKYARFFTSTFDSIKKKWPAPIQLKEINSTDLPEEALALNFDPSMQLIVFSKAVQQTLKPIINQLFYAVKKDGKWMSPAIVSFATDGADYTDPMITDDGKTLWFASDRPGGYGGFDLWKSEITANGTFGEPVNAGNEINTSGNEICPFQKPNEYFYFSSDFHPGIGGFDIFQAQKNNGKWQVEALPPPINSACDDLSIQFFGNREKGFFTSNRKGSHGMDIYSFFLPPKLFQCFGKIHDSETDSILPDVNIRIVGSDGSSQKIRSVNGRFQASLNPGNDYAIVVFANGYLNAQAKLSTRGLHQAKEFDVDIKSIPTNKPIRIDNINYESGKWDLLPQAKSSLDKLVDLLKLNPEAIIEISSHTDDVGDELFNQELSEKRANSVVQYLTEKGISAKNLNYKGYGESVPLKVSQKQARQYPFLKIGELLDASTIDKLGNDNLKEIARSLNRRTDFRVEKTGATNESK